MGFLVFYLVGCLLSLYLFLVNVFTCDRNVTYREIFSSVYSQSVIFIIFVFILSWVSVVILIDRLIAEGELQFRKKYYSESWKEYLTEILGVFKIW